MGTTVTIISVVFGGIAALILVAAIAVAIRERLKPLEKRKAAVLRKLHQNESETGATSVLTGNGLSDDTVREMAKANGFEWVGHSGQSNRQLNFQRILPGQDQRAPQHRETVNQPPEQAFLAKLADATPDIRGRARINMSDIATQSHWRDCMDIARAHGWTLHSFDYQRDGKYWVLVKQGTNPVARREDPFITGPGLAQLRDYPEARAAAEQAERELGVNPLAEQQLERARTQHTTLWRKATRYGGLAIICGLAFLILLFIAPSQFQAGGTGAVVVTILGIALILGTLTGWLLATRTLKARKTAVHHYTEGYERVVAAVLQRDD